MADCYWQADVLLEGDWRGASSTLIENGRRRILVDTGMPHDAHRLLSALEQRGLAASDIECVINTHFHIDHISNNCLFPQSLIYGTQQSHDWCQALYADLANPAQWKKLMPKYYPEIFDYENISGFMAKLRNIALRWWDRQRIGKAPQFRWMESHKLPDGIDVLFTSGHVPGHASLILKGDHRTVVIAGDALLSREHDDRVLTMIPHYREQYQKDRQQILAIAGKIIPGHDHAFTNTIPATHPALAKI
jgi:glyoxylase-like metal-dependent hydrolase (beta-lactamase superfamily II)